MLSEPSTHKKIEDSIQTASPGSLVFPIHFLEDGSPDAIHQVLSRLVRQNMIIRLGKGIYLKPKQDELLGSVLPSLEDIAQQIAAKEQVIIRPTGAYALNKLGLSTQVPTKVIYLTNGSRRTIKIGRGTLSFKPTTPKKLAAENELVFLAIQALITLGEKGTTDRVIQTLTDRLKNVPPSVIRADARHAPQQVAQTLLQIAAKLKNND